VKPDVLLARIRRADNTNVSFDDLVRLVQALGFREVGGRDSHRVFAHPDVAELVNLQVERGQAKALPGQASCGPWCAVQFVVGGGAMNPGYRIEVFWSDEDEVWIADVPDLPMCSAHGPTPHEAVGEVEQAIEAWLDAARATGRPAPKPSSRTALA
jgi:predicted RNase H-like HicB family nuclease/predicted RNA binding protein YcfA (HicA-like mRNA interferase family)